MDGPLPQNKADRVRVRNIAVTTKRNGLLALSITLCLRFATAFVPSPVSISLHCPRGLRPADQSLRPTETVHQHRRRGVGPVMCSPVQTSIDPTLASALASFCVDGVLGGLEQLGLGPPRGGACRVTYREGRAMPDRRSPVLLVGQRLLRRWGGLHRGRWRWWSRWEAGRGAGL